MSDQPLGDKGREQWNQKAQFWDELHGDAGNNFHRTLISPAVERLLELQAGERVLDVACGSGVLARRLAALGAEVTAVDFSDELIRLAQERGQSAGEVIQYKVVDASDEAALVALGVGSFDAITCTMALMDMADIAPLFRAVAKLLTAEGRFVLATAHPSFNSSNPAILHEVGDRDGQVYHDYSIKLHAYLDIPPVLAAGAVGEPNPHDYYHRPLHDLLNTAFAAGLVLDGLEEPGFPPPAEDDAPEAIPTWRSVWQFPPVLAARLRVGSR
jgi:ubiquinone/menaquinone biosynthesis C-methylase UbiE